MGVPKFYRWISERYPCLSEVVKEHQIPEFDNLYLDMNGIIHQCSHPNDEDVHFRISEEKIFSDIFHYLEVLFRIIKPRKVFFMAVDGVAPRAKMNQQRGRRFRSAKEAEDKIKKALEKGEILPTEARFDSNCITPGTDFMARLQDQLQYFVNNKLTSDRNWQGVRVFLSGHETPGEGEHKIMEFIRSENARPGHDPNTRHCLYGLDADLIMLGLTSHEPHFSLLREEVRFGGKKSQKRITAPEETTFHLLHLSLMREYIDYEFSALRTQIGFQYDLERIIDDWVLMGFLVGNDFIPHLPHLHINHDALPLLYRTYISVLPQLGGYLNENGHLNLHNFEKYLEKLSEFDREHFSEVFVDLKWFESKLGNKYLNEAAGMAAEKEAGSRKSKKREESALCLAALTSANKEQPEEEEEEDEIFETELRQYKRTYYMTKMGVDVVSDEFLSNQAKCYVEGIQWILHYYYHGVQSWSWYYPYHYAPFLSDIRNIAELRLTFDLGRPFMPFQQLLAVLPAASKDLLPQSYRHLMTSDSSSIIQYYPVDFKTDLNGKQQEWEAVVLIPFIDERCLLAAMEPCNERLTKAEAARNKHTECVVYSYDPDMDSTYPSPLPLLFPNITHCHVRQTPVPLDAWHVSVAHVGRPIDRSVLYYCGFPTLQHIKHKFYKKKSGVMVFQQPSRGENTILEILPSHQGEPLCEEVAAQVLGRAVFVSWPHLEEARVVAVSDGETRFFLEEPPGVQKVYDQPSSPPPTRTSHLSDKEHKDWVKDVQGNTEHFLKRKGIVVKETAVLVYVQQLTGRKYVPLPNGSVVLEKQWSRQVLPFPYQTVVQDIEAFDSSHARFRTLEELFPPSTSVFMVGHPYYGAMGEVLDSSDVIKEGRVRVVFNVPQEPQLEALIHNQHKFSVRYSPGYILASRLGVTSYLVSRFSGSIFIGRGSKRNPCGEQKANVGLNLKFNKKNEEVPGYTRRTEKEWLYSSAVEDLLAEYLDRFSEVFDLVSRNSHDDVFYEDDIWPAEDHNGAQKVSEITSWLREHPVSQVGRTSCDLQVLDGNIVEKIEEQVERAKTKKSSKKVRVTVRPHLLFRPMEQHMGVVPDPDAEFQLFDRVVNIRDSFTVPLGLRGTVVGIQGAAREPEVLYEVVFDEEFVGGLTIRCTMGRGYRLPSCALINLSHGSRAENGGHKLTAIVKPQPSSHRQASLPHSSRPSFTPTQVKEEFSNAWQTVKNAGPPQKPPGHWQSSNKPQQHASANKTVRHTHTPNKTVRHSHTPNKTVTHSHTPNKTVRHTHTPNKTASTEFEELIANLKISHSNQQISHSNQQISYSNPHGPAPLPPPQQASNQSDGPLSPQSFAMKGTMVLKEMLKIDSPSPAPSGGQQPTRRRSSKKLGILSLNLSHTLSQSEAHSLALTHTHSLCLLSAAQINAPHADPGVVAELSRVCMGLGIGAPEISSMRTGQGLIACQVKLSNGLVLQGPQCPSDYEAKEKAAVLTLQRLTSMGLGFPLPPSMFSGIGPMRNPHMGATPPLFNQSGQSTVSTGGVLMPPQAYGPLWGLTPPHPSQPFFMGPGTFPGAARGPAPSLPIGSHNQFVPLQVTKKRVSSNRKCQDGREFYRKQNPPTGQSQATSQHTCQSLSTIQHAGQSQGQGKVDPPPGKGSPAPSGQPEGMATPPRQAPPHTPGSASKRRHRKLAVNFLPAKVTE
ncbi:unnamed protein product [Lota lota]